ncbi:hypothetical protein F4776DRAFT_660011 [Hypoxylon sp. NC0597]|nr:hypothetical protein F4776DRAFT_660011 [Hypoxylon sp. NC0597]
MSGKAVVIHTSRILSLNKGQKTRRAQARHVIRQQCGSNDQPFPSTVPRTKCNNPSASFNLRRRADGGADLELWHEETSGGFAHGVHAIQAKEIVWTNEQSLTGKVQVYQAAKVLRDLP